MRIGSTVVGAGALVAGLVVGSTWRRVRADGVPDTTPLFYGGFLEKSGTPVDDPQRSMTIRLWPNPSPQATEQLLCETVAHSTAVTQGRFRIPLDTGCKSAVNANNNVWIEVLDGATSLGRSRIAAVPYAIETDHALSASSAAGGLEKRIKDLEDRLTAVQELAPPPGSLMMFAGPAAPAGWLICDGSMVSRSSYGNLFRVIGISFGAGDGSTTFRLLDFRGIFPKGAGQQGTASFGGPNYVGSLGSYTQDQLQGHHHSNKSYGTEWNSDILATANVGSNNNGSLGTANGPRITGNEFQITDPYTDGSNGRPRTGATTEPASLGINFIIKL